jgi:type II secretory pathway pseudopilin PulG
MGKSAAIILAGISAAAGVASGVSGMMASKQQAEAAQEQAEASARAQAQENIAFEKQQKLQYLKSGVELSGSPLLVMAETRRKGLENIENTLGSGQQTASSALASGRSALFSGLTSAASSAAGSFGGENMAGQGRTFNPATQAPLRKPI